MSREPNPEQLAIINKDEGAYLVSAPPGSGKTFVLTQRVIRLLAASPTDQFRILALTFTTKAAENMRARVESEIGDNWRRVLITNFHSFCLDVLQRYGEPLGLSPDMTLYENEDDRLGALVRGLNDDGLDIGTSDDELKTLRSILSQIGRLKRDLVPVEASPTAKVFDLTSIRIAYSAYDRTLRHYNALDFDDLLILTYRLLFENQRIARHFRKLYKYILVDEAQDTSRAQYEILKCICGSDHRNVMLVADADQYIYRFAGASDRYLHQFLSDFKAELVPLKVNYRCATSIVLAANSLIANNPDRLSPNQTMRSGGQARGQVSVLSFRDEAEEAASVVSFVQELLNGGLSADWVVEGESTELQPHDICILGRFRYSLIPIVKELERQNIPFQFNNAEVTLFESSLFQFIYYGLKILVNSRDLMSRENLLSLCDECSFTEDQLSELRDSNITKMFERLSVYADRPVCQASKIFEAYSTGTPNPVELIEQFRKLSSADDSSIDESLRALHMIDFSNLRDRWDNCCRRFADQGESLLSDLIGEIALAGRSVIEGDGIRVLTVHSAKGLEYQAVIVAGLVEGGFPDFRSSKTAEGVAEERRNAYVAITRAARRLILTYPRSRVMPWGDKKSQSPSRFITEMNLSTEHR